jgi:hypothetical protein
MTRVFRWRLLFLAVWVICGLVGASAQGLTKWTDGKLETASIGRPPV